MLTPTTSSLFSHRQFLRSFFRHTGCTKRTARHIVHLPPRFNTPFHPLRWHQTPRPPCAKQARLKKNTNVSSTLHEELYVRTSTELRPGQFCNRAFSRSEHRSRHERSRTSKLPSFPSRWSFAGRGSCLRVRPARTVVATCPAFVGKIETDVCDDIQTPKRDRSNVPSMLPCTDALWEMC